MKRSRTLALPTLPVTVAVAVAITVLASMPGFAAPGDTTRVSVASDGTQANGDSWARSMSADGRFVAFTSVASNLVQGDANGTWDMFVRDRIAGTTERVSVAFDGTQANGTSSEPSISADGRFVAFYSNAYNLVPGDTNGTDDVFVRDRVAGTTERASVASNGDQANRTSYSTSMNADGRLVAFTSHASNLVPGDTNGTTDVFVRDRAAGTTEQASVAFDGTPANGTSSEPSISADGRFVAFYSNAYNLVPGDTNGTDDVFVRDRVAGTTERVSIASDGSQANDTSFEGPSISADGRFVAFRSNGSNLVPGDTNGTTDVFVRDRIGGTTERVSVASDGTQANGFSRGPSINADGRSIAFYSDASNLVPMDTNLMRDVFVRDRAAGTTKRVSVASDGTQANNQSIFGSSPISADGRFVAFSSAASNLVPGDTNGAQDVFLHERSAPTPPAGNFSLSLNGSTAYAEAPNAPELNPTDWTFEVWFKDENPTYNHPRARILTKGDIASAEVPYFASIDSNLLYVGLRSGGAARVVTFNLATGGVTPNAWHHLAASFQASSRTLTIYIDGVQRAQGVLASTSGGNSLPLIGGKSGTAGDYWKGKLDDLRIWNVVRTAAEIASAYQTEIGAAPPGLVGNWHFNEGFGTTAADSAGTPQDLNLLGGAGWATDTPFGAVVPTATATPGGATSTATRTSTPAPATPTPTSTPAPATLTPTPTSTPPPGGGDFSLLLNGTTAYAEAANAAELNPASWTFEVWFKDDNPSYAHGRTRILTKGNITAAEVPYFASIDSNLLYVGLRSGGNGRTVTFNLATGGITPNAWHHLAASFQASSRTLTIYLDGVQRAQGVLASGSAGNTLPLIVGRSGTSGDYWRGKLDDLRLWNVVRTAAEIAGNYQTELGTPPAGLVGNWRFNEGGGNTAFDSAGAAQNMSLLGGATFSSEMP